MVVVDQRVVFDAFDGLKDAVEKLSLMVTGTVYMVNYKHRVFHVVYHVGTKEMRTSFKFCDIGDKVKVLK